MSYLRLATLAGLLAATGLHAQDATPAAPEAATTAALGLFERWQADPTQVFDAGDIALDQLEWQLRPLVVFADTPNDPRFIQQMARLMDEAALLAERDVIIITDTNPEAQTALRLQLRPRGYMMALIGKDGRVALRKPAPWSVRELTRSIDKMPLRLQEIRDRRVISP